MFKYIVIAMLILFSLGCKTEGETENRKGRVYAIIDWSDDVSFVDLNEITVNFSNGFKKNILYNMKLEYNGKIYWQSNGIGYSILYKTDKADYGIDKIYSFYFSEGSSAIIFEGYK